MIPTPQRQVAAMAHRIACLLLIVSAWMCSLTAAERPYAVYLMKIDGSQTRKLAQVEGYADHYAPRWSHDGKHVVFGAVDPKTQMLDLFAVNADGSGLRKVGPGGRPDWSPDGKQIASDFGREIFVQNADGQGRARIAFGECPRWSPDGSEIAVADDQMLHIVDVISGEQRDLFDQPLASVLKGCCWSPDGQHLALVVRPPEGKRRQILVVNSRGANHGVDVLLESDGAVSGWVSYSPDGKRLAYCATELIRILDIEGNQRPRLVPDQKGKNLEPDWSPDGKWFVFRSNRE